MENCLVIPLYAFIHFAGGAEMKEDQLKICIRTALKRHAEVLSLVTTALGDEPVG